MKPMSRPAGLVLTSTDLEIFRWLWMLRVSTLGQIRRVHYFQSDAGGRLSAFDNVRKRLRRLMEAGYLTADTFLDTKERIYMLAEGALPRLAERYGIMQTRLYEPRGNDTLTQVRHPLMVSEIATRILESLRGSAVALVDLEPLVVPFVHTHAIADPSQKRHVDRFVSQFDLEVDGAVLRIRPDLVFALKIEGRARLFFVEADLGSESSQQIAEKIRGYHVYRISPDPQSPSKPLWWRYGPFEDFRVLFVTVNDQRVKTLMRVLAGKPGFDLSAFSTLRSISEQNMVFAGAWASHQGAGRPLLKDRPEAR